MAGREGDDQEIEEKVLQIIDFHQLAHEVNQVERHEDHCVEYSERVVYSVLVVNDYRQIDGNQRKEKVPKGIALRNVLISEGLFEVSVEIEH